MAQRDNGPGSQIPNPGPRTPDPAYRIPDSGSRIPCPAFRMPSGEHPGADATPTSGHGITTSIKSNMIRHTCSYLYVHITGLPLHQRLHSSGGSPALVVAILPDLAPRPSNGIWHSHEISGIWHSAFGIRHSAFGIRDPAFGVRHPGSGIRHPGSDIRHSAFDVRRSAFGIRHSGSGIWRSASGI